MNDFVAQRFNDILFSSWQHFSLVIQCLAVAAVLAVLAAALTYRSPVLRSAADSRLERNKIAAPVRMRVWEGVTFMAGGNCGIEGAGFYWMKTNCFVLRMA